VVAPLAGLGGDAAENRHGALRGASSIAAGQGRDPAATLRVECLTTIGEMERLAPEWRSLFDRVSDALPFVSYEWAFAWWKHLRRASGPLRDTLRLFVVRDSAGRVLAIAPMMRTEIRVAGVCLVRILQPIGTDPNITEVRGMLVSAGREADVLEALARHVRQHGAGSWVQWCGIRRQGDAVARLRAVQPTTTTKETPTFLLALPSSWEEFRKAFPRNLRESLRKCYNSLARDSHEWTFRAVSDPSALRAAADRLIELHGVRAARVDTIRHRDCFEAPAARAFLHEVVALLGARGAVRAFQLEIAGEIVATRLAFVFGDRMYLYYSGYDQAWARYSVMTTVVAEALKHAIEHGIRSANLSTGPDESKMRWRPTAVDYLDERAVGSGLYARLVHRAMNTPVRDMFKRTIGRG
jgi:CelD/BcsL family acetyltransferase involved in cellulose biosynthesis